MLAPRVTDCGLALVVLGVNVGVTTTALLGERLSTRTVTVSVLAPPLLSVARTLMVKSPNTSGRNSTTVPALADRDAALPAGRLWMVHW